MHAHVTPAIQAKVKVSPEMLCAIGHAPMHHITPEDGNLKLFEDDSSKLLLTLRILDLNPVCVQCVCMHTCA